MATLSDTLDNAEWNERVLKLAKSRRKTGLAAAILALTPAPTEWEFSLNHEPALALYQRDPDAARPLLLARLRASLYKLRELYQAAIANGDDVLIDFLNYRLLYHMPGLLKGTVHENAHLRGQAQTLWDWGNTTVIDYYTHLYSKSPERFARQIARMATCDRRGTWALKDPGSPSPAMQFVLHAHPEALIASVEAMTTLFNAKHRSARKWALSLLNTDRASESIHALRTQLIDLARRERFDTARKAALAPLRQLASQPTKAGADALDLLLALTREAGALGKVAMIEYVRARHARNF